MNDKEALVRSIRPGDRVTIRTPQGQERTGRAVICSGTYAALNMGGQYGRPGVVNASNVVRVSPAKPIAQPRDYLLPGV